MIDPEVCGINLRINANSQNQFEKAIVTIKQDGARLSNFYLKDGPHGLYLDPPKIKKANGEYYSLYFDENRERYKRLQARVIESYKEKLKSATTNEIVEEINFDNLMSQPL